MTTHKQKVLALLRDGKPHTHHELYQLGCVAHSRISDLRRDGHRIEQWRDGDVYLYRLLGETAEGERVVPSPSAVSPSSPPNPVGDDGEQGAPRDGGQLELHIPRNAYDREIQATTSVKSSVSKAAA